MTTLEEFAAQVDALGANQRDLATTVRDLSGTVERLDAQGGDTNARVRSLEDNVADVKDLLVRALEK